jgi:hypothetical protein
VCARARARARVSAGNLKSEPAWAQVVASQRKVERDSGTVYILGNKLSKYLLSILASQFCYRYFLVYSIMGLSTLFTKISVLTHTVLYIAGT